MHSSSGSVSNFGRIPCKFATIGIQNMRKDNRNRINNKCMNFLHPISFGVESYRPMWNYDHKRPIWLYNILNNDMT